MKNENLRKAKCTVCGTTVMIDRLPVDDEICAKCDDESGIEHQRRLEHG